MGKTKKTDDVYRLEKELREYKDIIKSLERQLKKRDKEEKVSTSEKKKEKPLKEEKDKCPDCKSGDIIVSDLGVRIISSCSKKCGWRKITKFNGSVKKEET